MVDDLLTRLLESEGFQWDRGNAPKLWDRHEVAPMEAEQVFFNRPLVTTADVTHSRLEPRFYALGRTDAGRRLFVGFTLRGRLIRVISARPMSRRERRVYERQEKAGKTPRAEV